MSEELTRVLARIQQIQGLLGQTSPPNEDFGAELDRSAGSRSATRTTASLPDTKYGIRNPPDALAPLIQEVATKTGVPEDLISAVMATESGYRPDAVSPAGAVGLMQLMPATARDLDVDDPYDPRQNVLGGAEYLRQQLDRFGTVEKALAAYNAGPRAVEEYDGIPPFSETQSYVQRVLQTLRRLTGRQG